MTKLACMILLLAPTAFAEGICDLVEADEAAALLGGTTTSTAVGQLGCSYSNRARGLRLTVTMMDLEVGTVSHWLASFSELHCRTLTAQPLASASDPHAGRPAKNRARFRYRSTATK